MIHKDTIHTITTIDKMKNWQKEQRLAERTIGFVPTMGFLHEGHAALIQEAKKLYDTVVVSVFVNPTQFGPTEDFDAYPRDIASDLVTAQSAGADVLFCPDQQCMYPNDGGIRINAGPLANRLCGESRPGHFDGVLQVVLKLVNIISPDGVVFGMKDAQQLAIIETFFRDYNMPATIIRVATVREDDGLAKSSRNVNLTEAERLEAPHIYEALQQARVLLEDGVRYTTIEKYLKDKITTLTSGNIDYVSILSYPQLTDPTRDTEELILACAVKFSKTRLIDNIIVRKKA